MRDLTDLAVTLTLRKYQKLGRVSKMEEEKRIRYMNPLAGKKKMLAGILIAIPGGFLFLIGMTGNPTAGAIGTLLMIPGIIVYLIGKAQHWYWNK